MVCSKYSNIPNMRKGVATHSTIDNNDKREDKMIGFGTTHDTKSQRTHGNTNNTCRKWFH